MRTKIEVLLPIAEQATPKHVPPAPRIPNLQGKTVGLIKNGWRSLGITYELYQRELVERYGVNRVLVRETTNSGPVPEPGYQELVAQADAVICGLAN